jgi:hypothetical protein
LREREREREKVWFQYGPRKSGSNMGPGRKMGSSSHLSGHAGTGEGNPDVLIPAS